MDVHNHIPTEWVKRAAQGDVAAQAWLYQQYSRAMYNICIRMTGNRQDAEDVLQNGFMLAFKSLAQLRELAGFGGWLRRIVIHGCIRHMKQGINWVELGEDHAEGVPAEEEVNWWADISLEMVHREIQLLPEGCRQVFVLYALEDFAHRDIAAQLGITESTSKSQYWRAKQLLQSRIIQIMERHG